MTEPARDAERELAALQPADDRRAVLLLDAAGRLLDSAGDLTHFGLAGLDEGADACEILPLLYQRRELAGNCIRFVQMPSEVVADVSLEQRPGYLLIGLIAVTGQHQALQQQQQKANELSLLQRQQSITLTALQQAHRQVQQQRDELDRLYSAQREYLHKLSHEVRNPLQAMLAGLEDAATLDNDRTARLRRNTWQLLTLVENLLAHEQQQPRDFAPEAVEPALLADDCVHLLRPLARDKGLRLELDCPAALSGRRVHVDGYRVRQILFNLIGNAIRYTRRGSVQVQVRLAQQLLTIRVSDTGPGIAPDDQKRLFSAYQRGPEKAGHGAGLGLAISRELAEGMGGKLTLDSAVGQGSTFELQAPVQPADNEASLTGADSLRALNGRAVLVDDDPDLREALSGWLRTWGIDVTLCENITALRQLLSQAAPDWLILDRNLPDGQGDSMLAELSAHWPACYVILLSGDEPEVAPDNGGVHCLQKPVTRSHLHQALATGKPA